MHRSDAWYMLCIPRFFRWKQYFTLPHVSYRTPPDYLESKMAVESKEVCPVESAGLLCWTGLFWSPKRFPVDSAGLVHFQETYNIHIQYMLPDWTGLDWTGPLSRNIQHTYLIYVTGLCWTVLDWSIFKKHTTYIYLHIFLQPIFTYHHQHHHHHHHFHDLLYFPFAFFRTCCV